jgi:aryl-alcohol dehydrogenase-like predicted oxidoreductase
MNERGMKVLAALDEAAVQHDATVAQVALAWLLDRPTITAPIIGANSPDQLRELLPATEINLSLEAIQAIDKASAWA